MPNLIQKKKINIFELMRKSYPIKSRFNTLYKMYKVNITKQGEKNGHFRSKFRPSIK
jgi:hypothetical protein